MPHEHPLQAIVAITEGVLPTDHPILLWGALDEIRRAALAAAPVEAQDEPNDAWELRTLPANAKAIYEDKNQA